MTDDFPEAFQRYLKGYHSIRGKGITDFQLLLDDVEQWGIKSPIGGMTYQQKKGLAIEASRENLDNIYITQETYKNGQVRTTRRDYRTGLFISPETGTHKIIEPKVWFDGRYWRDEGGHFAKKPLREDEPI